MNLMDCLAPRVIEVKGARLVSLCNGKQDKEEVVAAHKIANNKWYARVRSERRQKKKMAWHALFP